MGRNEIALEHFERALELAADVCSHDPANTEWQDELARIRVQAGKLLVALGRTERGRELLDGAVEVWQALVELDPTRGAWRDDLEGVERVVSELTEPAPPEPAGTLAEE